MYLESGKEIYESEKFPGYYIEADTGNFCDENGNLIGGNQDNGDIPGGKGTILDVPDFVYISKTGKLYYPRPTAAATLRIRIEDADRKGYKPSQGYLTFVKSVYKKHLKKQSKRSKK